MIIITKNHFYNKIIFEDSEYDDFLKLHKYFSITDPKLTYTVKVRSGQSDGKVKFINKRTGEFLKGLTDKIKTFLDSNNISYVDESESLKEDYEIEDMEEFIKTFQLPFEPYYFQKDALKIGIENKQKIILAATSSGKSLLLYMLSNYLRNKDKDENILILVPDTGLVNQLYSDFKEYEEYKKEFDEETFKDTYHKIFSGQEKNTNHQIKISTWQSIYDLEESHKIFETTTTILVDEMHMAQANSYMSIFQKAYNTKKRIGVSGTMPKDLIESLRLEGIFNQPIRIVSARELQDLGLATESIVQPIYLDYDDEDKKDLRHRNTDRELPKNEKGYIYEMKLIKSHKERLKTLAKFILTLSKKQDGNTIVLFKNVDYGDLLYKVLSKYHKNTFLIKGDIKASKREEIRQNMSKYKDAILLGTDKIVSTGINIPSLKYMVIAQNFKSEIKLIQSLGRLMRLHEGKDTSILFDMVDNLTYISKNGKGKSYENYSKQWYLERLSSYEKYNFIVKNPKRIKLKLKDDLL